MTMGNDDRAGGAMYRVVHWGGIVTLVLWTAFAAYSVLIGM